MFLVFSEAAVAQLDENELIQTSGNSREWVDSSKIDNKQVPYDSLSTPLGTEEPSGEGDALRSTVSGLAEAGYTLEGIVSNLKNGGKSASEIGMACLGQGFSGSEVQSSLLKAGFASEQVNGAVPAALLKGDDVLIQTNAGVETDTGFISLSSDVPDSIQPSSQAPQTLFITAVDWIDGNTSEGQRFKNLAQEDPALFAKAISNMHGLGEQQAETVKSMLAEGKGLKQIAGEFEGLGFSPEKTANIFQKAGVDKNDAAAAGVTYSIGSAKPKVGLKLGGYNKPQGYAQMWENAVKKDMKQAKQIERCNMLLDLGYTPEQVAQAFYKAKYLPLTISQTFYKAGVNEKEGVSAIRTVARQEAVKKADKDPEVIEWREKSNAAANQPTLTVYVALREAKINQFEMEICAGAMNNSYMESSEVINEMVSYYLDKGVSAESIANALQLQGGFKTVGDNKKENYYTHQINIASAFLQNGFSKKEVGELVVNTLFEWVKLKNPVDYAVSLDKGEFGAVVKDLAGNGITAAPLVNMLKGSGLSAGEVFEVMSAEYISGNEILKDLSAKIGDLFDAFELNYGEANQEMTDGVVALYRDNGFTPEEVWTGIGEKMGASRSGNGYDIMNPKPDKPFAAGDYKSEIKLTVAMLNAGFSEEQIRAAEQVSYSFQGTSFKLDLHYPGAEVMAAAKQQIQEQQSRQGLQTGGQDNSLNQSAQPVSNSSSQEEIIRRNSQALPI